jgi:hypothetical protein
LVGHTHFGKARASSADVAQSTTNVKKTVDKATEIAWLMNRLIFDERVRAVGGSGEYVERDGGGKVGRVRC